MTLTWDILNIIGTIAFAISSAMIAIEEDYDILGILILGLTAAFGGGAVRDLLIGIPIKFLTFYEPKIYKFLFITCTFSAYFYSKNILP
jgi:uncharacterized membrane protein YeiH